MSDWKKRKEQDRRFEKDKSNEKSTKKKEKGQFYGTNYLKPDDSLKMISG